MPNASMTFCDDALRRDAVAVVPGVARADVRGGAERLADHRRALDRPVEPQRAQAVDERLEVVELGDADVDGHERLGLGHEPDARLHDDAEVRLLEDPVHRRAVARLVEMPGRAVRHRAHARAQQGAVGQHDLVAAVLRAVLAVGRVAEPAVQAVADEAAPAQLRAPRPTGVWPLDFRWS